MFKIFFNSLLLLTFSSAAFAQDSNRNAYIKSAVPKYGAHRAAGQKQTVTTTTRTYRTAAAPRPTQMAAAPTENTQTLNRIEQTVSSWDGDQWMNYLMKGVSVGFEYTRMGAENHAEIKDSFGNRSTTGSNADPASVLGLSVMYNRLGRDALGFSVGGTLFQKIENDNGQRNTLGYSSGITMLRPEGNILLGHSSGVWAGLGAHMNYINGDSTVNDAIEQFGWGAQARVGFVPTRHLNFDLGYSVSIHKFGSTMKNAVRVLSATLDEEKSYYAFSAWSLRATYLF